MSILPPDDRTLEQQLADFVALQKARRENRDPAYMTWDELCNHMWAKIDDEQEDDDLVATRAELLALLDWADKFNRDAQPRRDEEEATYAIIRKAAEMIKSGNE